MPEWKPDIGGARQWALADGADRHRERALEMLEDRDRLRARPRLRDDDEGIGQGPGGGAAQVLRRYGEGPTPSARNASAAGASACQLAPIPVRIDNAASKRSKVDLGKSRSCGDTSHLQVLGLGEDGLAEARRLFAGHHPGRRRRCRVIP